MLAVNSYTHEDHHGFGVIWFVLLLVCIGALACGLFFYLDPKKELYSARDTERQTDVQLFASALQRSKTDDTPGYEQLMLLLRPDEVYMITTHQISKNCSFQNALCETPVSSPSHCADVSFLKTEGYVDTVPTAPNELSIWNKDLTGYTLEKTQTGSIIVRACESEHGNEITVTEGESL